MMTFRRHLFLIVLAAMVPFLTLSCAAVIWVAHLQGTAARQGLDNTSRALAIALDERIETWKAALSVLATSPTLNSSDLTAFYTQAKFVAEQNGGWVVVSLPSGQQVINTLVPFGEPLPRSPPATLPPRLSSDGVAHDLFIGPVVNRQIIAVTVPSVRNGTITHYVHLGVLPERLSDILTNQQLPAGWRATLIDGQGRIVARTPHLPQSIGRPFAEWSVQSGSDGRSGITTRGDARNSEYINAIEPLSNARWTIAVEVPSTTLTAAWRRPLALLLAAGTVLILITAAAVSLLGARVTRPIQRLADAARTVTGGGSLPELPSPRVVELATLRDAVFELAQKQTLLREANHRIKNSLQIVSAGLALQSRATESEEARDQLHEAQARLQAIARMHERLYREDQFEDVDALSLARSVCEDTANIGAGRVTLRFDAEGEARIGADAAGSFALVLAELTTNAMKHASRPGQPGSVRVRCAIEDGPVISVVISDNGPGLPPDFDLSAQKGLGLRTCLALASQIGGSLRAIPSSDGATFELRVPAIESPVSAARYAT